MQGRLMMLKGRKSSRALLSWKEEEDYPTEADKYELIEEIGRGATARVSITHQSIHGELYSHPLLLSDSPCCHRRSGSQNASPKDAG